MKVKLYKLHNLYYWWITSYGQTIINSWTEKCITSLIGSTAQTAKSGLIGQGGSHGWTSLNASPEQSA